MAGVTHPPGQSAGFVKPGSPEPAAAKDLHAV